MDGCLAMLTTRDGVALRLRRGQDLGDGVWPVMRALLPRAALLEVPLPQPDVSRSPRRPLRAAVAVAGPISRFAARCSGQLKPSGDVLVVSGVGAKGASSMRLSGGKGLGPDGAQRLADLLREAPPPMLESMDLRCAP